MVENETTHNWVLKKKPNTIFFSKYEFILIKNLVHVVENCYIGLVMNIYQLNYNHRLLFFSNVTVYLFISFFLLVQRELSMVIFFITSTSTRNRH